jgi:phosphoenolpyruvate carboxylase
VFKGKFKGVNVERKIPRTMSTQHPDNASMPSWCLSDIIQGDDEIREAYFVYKELGCQEVMWDSEGKDVDTRVVRKLLSNYGEYFRRKILGKDVFLTYRIPNPHIDVVERKIVLETLWNIPVASDVASAFYGKEAEPIFEVILPFTTNSEELIRLFNFYKRGIANSETIELDGSSTKLRDWVGSLRPQKIEVIPLVEDIDSLLRVDEIIDGYLRVIKPGYIRVFLARSDPALNYGLFCSVLLCKLALSKLYMLSKRSNAAIYPIIGAGSVPFRGHLSPDNVQNFINEYLGAYTVTIQSAFKYDYSIKIVREAVKFLNENLPVDEAVLIEPHEEKILLSIIGKFRSRYQAVIEKLAPLINSVASHVPRRRARKLHIGLFGYSRSVRGIALPRAIPFVASLYSIGIPPELIGAGAIQDLNEEEWDTLRRYYVNLEEDLKGAACYLSWQNINMLKDMSRRVTNRSRMSEESLKFALERLLADFNSIEKNLGVKLGPVSLRHRKHENITSNFFISYLERKDHEARAYLIDAAKVRNFLG